MPCSTIFAIGMPRITLWIHTTGLGFSLGGDHRNWEESQVWWSWVKIKNEVGKYRRN
jgi:hypothetical protein